MSSAKLASGKLAVAHFLSLLGVAAMVLLVTSVANAQTITTTTSITDGRTPSSLTAGAPVGSYALSGFDNINLYNGNLNFRMPLLNVGGRGSAGMTIMMSQNSKSWRIKHTHKEMPDESTIDSYVPTQTGWGPYAGYGVGRLDGRNYGLQTSSNLTCRWYSKTVSRLTFSAADGTEYELRDQLTNGQPLNSTCTQGAYRGTVFITSNGSAATFVSDAPIYDNPAYNSFGPHGFTVSGFLMLRDGSRYRIDDGNVTWIRDRNGNKLSFTYSASSMTVTDSLNRTVTVNFDVSDVSPYGLCDQIIYQGFGGAQRILRISKTNLANVLRPNSGYSIRTLGGPTGLFPESTGSSSTYHDPLVTSAVWLPNGKSYKFYYNSYSELARVELPTGGAYEYDMTPGSGVICPNGCGWPDEDRQIYRRVVERRVYSAGGSGSSFDSKEVFTNTESVGTNTATVTVETFGPTGAVLARNRHHFDGSALDSLFGGAVVYAYGAWWEGNERETEILDTAGNLSSAAVLRRTVTSRAQRAPVSWWSSHASTYGLDPAKEPANDPRVTEVVTTLEPATANLVTKQTFAYDDSLPFNNQNNVKEYGFGTGSAGSLVRETRITYLTSSIYTDSTVHIRNLPTQVSIYDAGATERARSSIEYDNYTSDAYHAALVPRSNVSGFDSAYTPSYTTRGNATSSTAYLLVSGGQTGISTYSQFDVTGNPVKVIDARSTPTNIIATIIEYDDRFGSPDNEARSNTVPIELSGLTSFAFPTKVINTFGHTSYAQFDYYMGQPVNGEDANGVVASGSFNDLLGRPTQVRVGIGTSAEAQTTFGYDDDLRIVTTTSDLHATNDNILLTKVLYDQIGRLKETRQYEGGSNYIATQTEYDTLGRPFKTSNPFRPLQNQTPVWTTQVFDALSRVISVTTPDNSVVNVSYTGNTITATDQAGKKRKTVTDAFGRLMEVYEDPEIPGGPVELNYQTSYTYDVLDNLVKVTQGSQQRFFMYDSLKRLIRARNPEQATHPSLSLSDPITNNSAWSIGYQYDSNGNVIQKTDPRGVVSTYAYDALNRNTTIDYSDTSSINPDVSWFYDGAAYGKGRHWYSYSGGTETLGDNVEKTIFESYDPLGRPKVLKQVFKLNTQWKTPYEMWRSYNAAGSVISQRYPSERTVNYNYDSAGRLGDKDAQNLAFTGNLGGVQKTYSQGITYAPAGQLQQEQFGTTTSVYNKRFYNSRQQLAEILTSTSGGDSSWNRGKIINGYSLQCSGAACNATDNNGNLRKQEILIPHNEQMSPFTSWYQQYDYDELNRLKRVHEYTGNAALDWQQEYLYDRWGNRRIDTNVANTYGTGINNREFEKEDVTNRLYSPGDSALPETSKRIRYDEAGNQIKDTYTGYGTANFDAENRIIAIQNSSAGWSNYTYNADGERTRRTTGSQTTWQIYGFGGELLAEYAPGGDPSAPQKEYGYRNSELLVVAESAPAVATNVALASNGATATASSTWTNPPWSYLPSSVNNGDHRGLNASYNSNWTSNGTSLPQWVEVAFNGSKTIDRIDVFSLQDNYPNPIEPTESTTFSLYGLTAFEVQYWNGSTWTTVPGGSVSGNNKVWKKITFAPITTTKIRVHITATSDNWSRMVEVEAWTPGTPPPNVALASNGATATASSTWGNPPWSYLPSSVNNGDHRGLNAGSNSNWTSNGTSLPQWLEVAFNGSQTINQIDVFSLQDDYHNPVEPSESTTFSLYGLVAFEVQYWNNGAWTTIPGGSVSGNNKVWKKFTFAPITTTKIRVHITATSDNWSRLVEVEAWAASTGANINWLVSDHLGTPRMIIDQTGTLANVKRHDYLPFGEELFSGVGVRASGLGYAGGDGVRQQFTQYERDGETGLDFAKARYHSSVQGRFTTLDPENAGAILSDPQTWNGYSYVQNSPLNFVDPDGLIGCGAQFRTCGGASGGSSENAAAEARHDSIINSGYDPDLGVYRGDTEIQYTTAGYNVSRTVHNATEEELNAAIESTLASEDLVAQRGRGPVQPSGGSRRGGTTQGGRWVREINSRGRQQWRFYPSGPTWRDQTGRSPAPVRPQSLGFRSFSALKRHLGPAGYGYQWHHIVEQTPGNVARFGPNVIHNTFNIVPLHYQTHQYISAYYSSIRPFTNGKTVRQWLSTQSYEAQYAFGMKVLNNHPPMVLP